MRNEWVLKILFFKLTAIPRLLLVLFVKFNYSFNPALAFVSLANILNHC